MMISDQHDHYVIYKKGESIYKWKVSTLWTIAKGLVSVEVYVSDFDLNVDVWFAEYNRPTVANVIEHCKRIIEANLDTPIIITPDYIVLDGMHRVAKAKMLNKLTVKAIKLDHFPHSDFDG